MHRIPATWWKNPPDLETLDYVTEIDLEKVAPNIPQVLACRRRWIFLRDGKRVLILAYIDALELAFDFSQPMPARRRWREGRDYQRISA